MIRNIFTREQIREIARRLQEYGIRDTELPITEELDGNETVVIVQNGVNKRIPLSTIYTMSPEGTQLVDAIVEAVMQRLNDEGFSPTITTNMIEDEAVTWGKIANNAIGETKIAQDQIFNRHLHAKCVTGDKIDDHTITAENLGYAIVGTSNMEDEAVTSAKIKSQAITSTHLAQNAVQKGNMATTLLSMFEKQIDPTTQSGQKLQGTTVAIDDIPYVLYSSDGRTASAFSLNAGDVLRVTGAAGHSGTIYALYGDVVFLHVVGTDASESQVINPTSISGTPGVTADADGHYFIALKNPSSHASVTALEYSLTKVGEEKSAIELIDDLVQQVSELNGRVQELENNTQESES